MNKARDYGSTVYLILFCYQLVYNFIQNFEYLRFDYDIRWYLKFYLPRDENLHFYRDE